jgi:DNA-directed RNA polymerase specialized sigma24 family protein
MPKRVKAFLLRYVFDLNNDDIAKILGITARMFVPVSDH